jgi:hypothetical protein
MGLVRTYVWSILLSIGVLSNLEDTSLEHELLDGVFPPHSG